VNRQKITVVVLGTVLALASASAQDAGFFRLAESGTDANWKLNDAQY
jgi:hypothetical protein